MARKFFPTDAGKVEINHCRSLLSKDDHFKIDHDDELVSLATISQSMSRPDNANVKVTSITMSSLLVGKVQFGKLGTTHIPHVIQGLGIRNAATIAKTSMHKLTEEGIRTPKL